MYPAAVGGRRPDGGVPPEPERASNYAGVGRLP